jgi:SAM-dependent methyltransferase
MTPVFGEFLRPSGEHIAAAVSCRGELPYSAQCGAVRQLDRLVATLERYLSDLPLPDRLDPPREPERHDRTRAAPAVLALDRAAQSLRPAAAGAADASAGDAHPVVGHLSAAADHLAAGRDLLHTHFTDGPAGPRTPTSYWAPVITSGPVTAALLGELAGLDTGSSDAVLCVDAIQFAQQPDAAYREIQRVLAPGGRAVLTCWEPTGQDGERLPDRLRRVDLGAGLTAADFDNIQVRDRPGWRACERAMWEEAAELDPGDDPALQAFHDEGVRSLKVFGLVRRVIATATAPFGPEPPGPGQGRARRP